MELPPTLAPWTGALSLFPHDVALALGSMARHLAPALGAFRAHRASVEGDPDGFDGLARRGSYERLLMTEWLLAEEAPFEFLRRAGAGEHLFLRLSRPQPTSGRRCVAVFDAGPSQLGGPRLAQLALLIVLERRATAAGASFLWGVAQKPQPPRAGALDAAAIQRLLDARTAQPVVSDHVRLWRAQLGELAADEAWWVGPAVGPAPPGAARVEVEDTLDAGRPRVAVGVRGSGRTPLELVLDLPAPPLAARLLRDPFRAAVPAVSTAAAGPAPASNLVFSRRGDKLFARGLGDSIVAYPIPNSPRAPSGRIKLYAGGGDGRSLAVCALGRGALILRDGPSGLALVHPGGAERFGGTLEAPGFARPAVDAGLETLEPYPMHGAPTSVQVRDGARALWRIQWHPDGRASAERVADEVIAVTSNKESLVLLERPAAGHSKGQWLLSLAGARRAPWKIVPHEPLRALFGNAGEAGDPTFGLFALEGPAGEWHVSAGAREVLLMAPKDARVVGVGWNAERREPGLVLLEGERRRLTLLGRNWERPLVRTPAPILHVSVSATTPHLAYATEHELGVMTVEPARLLARHTLKSHAS